MHLPRLTYDRDEAAEILGVGATTSLPVAKSRRPPQTPLHKPFTLPHFRAWAADLVLDTGDSWTLEPFQEAFLADVFSGKPEVWLVVPEGNAKTTLVAGLALYHAQFRPFAFVAVAASSRDQAQTLYGQAEGFVLRSPKLHEFVHSPIQAAKGKRKLDVPRFNPLPGYRRLDHHEGGKIQIYAADDATGDGLIPTLAILDELHRHRDLRLYRTWAGKLQKRNGQVVAISTAGEPGSEFETTRERIRQQSSEVIRKDFHVRAVSQRLVMHEWAVPEKQDVADMAVVKRANPLKAITKVALADKFASPTMTLEHWRRFVCNLPTRGSNAAIQEIEWAAREAPEAIPEGERIWLGFDYAPKWDTTALVPFWWKSREYRQFGDGDVLVPPRDGSVLDGALIEASARKIHARNPIDTVVMDISRAETIARWFEEELGATVIDWPQSTPYQVREYERFMDAFSNGWLWHSADAQLTAHVMNAVVTLSRYGEPMFDRPAQGRNADQEHRVIDALKAGAMVHSAAVEANEAEPAVEPLMAVV